MKTVKFIELYLKEQVDITRVFPVRQAVRLCDLIVETYENEGTVYLCANGGTAGIIDNWSVDLANHPFVSDDKSKPLSAKVKRLDVVNLAVSPSVLTALANDFGVEYIYSKQIAGHIRVRDLLIGVSGSGNSANIINAVEAAKRVGTTTVGITRGTGGKLKEVADLCIVVPGSSQFPGQMGKNDNNFHFEDYVCSLSHMVTGILQKHVRDKYEYQSEQ